MAAGSAHPASANSLGARARRGDEGVAAQGSTRLASSSPRPAGQRRKGKRHVTPARRHRRRLGPGCRGGPSPAHRPSSRAGALAARLLADVAPAEVFLALWLHLGTPRGNVREPVLRHLTLRATIWVGKVRFGSELLSGGQAQILLLT